LLYINGAKTIFCVLLTLFPSQILPSEMPCFLFDASFTSAFFVVLHQIVCSILSAAVRWPYFSVSGLSDYLRHKEEREHVLFLTGSPRYMGQRRWSSLTHRMQLWEGKK